MLRLIVRRRDGLGQHAIERIPGFSTPTSDGNVERVVGIPRDGADARDVVEIWTGVYFRGAIRQRDAGIVHTPRRFDVLDRVHISPLRILVPHDRPPDLSLLRELTAVFSVFRRYTIQRELADLRVVKGGPVGDEPRDTRLDKIQFQIKYKPVASDSRFRDVDNVRMVAHPVNGYVIGGFSGTSHFTLSTAAVRP